MVHELLPGLDGVVAARECLTLVDSRAMPWEDWDGMPGSRIKTFVRGPAGEPLIYLTWSPPRTGGGEPHRHFHRTVREYHYVLDGEVPIWEYDSSDQQHGDFLLFRAGYYMDRAPGSLHGIEPVFASAVGRTMLCWRDRSGTYIGEADFDQETETVSYRGGWQPLEARETPPERDDGLVRERGGLTLLDTRAMPWEPFRGIPGGGSQKVLARDERGEPAVFLTWSPPGEIPGLALPHRHFHRSVTENVFVLAGEFPHWEYPDPGSREGEIAVFRAGWFMQRRPGAAGLHGLEPGRSSATGRLLLCWRDGTGNYVGDRDYDEETVVVP
jgi:uncharacterized cupin superfamily protein